LGANGAREFEGFLDGDGMIHCVTFPPNGTGGTYSNTYVDTQGRKIEKDSGSDKKYLGSLGSSSGISVDSNTGAKHAGVSNISGSKRHM